MRRIVKGSIKYISLVPRGMNKLPVIYKGDEGDDTNGTVDFETLIKGDMDKGEILAVVYAPELRDKEGDIASAEVIKEMAYGFSKDGKGIDIRHNEKALSKDDAYVAESFIVQKGDERFTDFKNYDGKPVDVTGGWAVVVKVQNEALKNEYRAGKWNGVSMGGTATVKAEKSDDELADNIAARLAERLSGVSKEQELDMTKEEVEAIVKKSVPTAAEIAAEIRKGDEAARVAKEASDKKAAEEAAKSGVEQAPIFKGDASDPVAVSKHAEALKMYELRKGVNWNDAASVEAYNAKLAEMKKGDGTKTEAQLKVEKLEKELADAKRASNQGTGDRTTDTKKEDGAEVVGLSKEDAALMASGSKDGKSYTDMVYGSKK